MGCGLDRSPILFGRSKSAAAKLQQQPQWEVGSRKQEDEIALMKNLMTSAIRTTNVDGDRAKKPQQLFKKNPNLALSSARNAVAARKCAKSSVSSAPSAPANQRPVTCGAKLQLNRARSSDPLDVRKRAGAFSVAPTKSTISIGR